MILVRLILNMLVVLVEVALVAGAAWLAWHSVPAFAAVTAGLALLLGLRLEVQRLTHESTFYLEQGASLAGWIRALIGVGEAILKGLLAGAVALITFSGTDATRLQVMAVIFGGVVFLGSSVLRRLTISFGVRPARWGYFRMAVPLGLLFSLALSFLPAGTLATVAWSAFFDLPARPSLAKVGEALFNVRQWIDETVVRLLAVWLGPQGARLAGIVLSTNTLAGFVIAVYAVAVSEVVRVIEELGWRFRFA